VPDQPISDIATRERAESELGDVLFVLANVGRRWGINPEEALRKSNAKFTRRFQAIEAAMKAMGLEMKDASLIEMEEAYQAAKAKEKRTQP
jgi:tetrapyrrole methylase family protein/MazG family protein